MKRLSLINILPSLFGLVAALSYPIAALGMLSASNGLVVMYVAEVGALATGLASMSTNKQLHTYRPLYLLNICWVLASAGLLALVILQALHG